MTKVKWEANVGSDFIDKVGIESGDYVLDFGCGEGLFSIPAAQKVGSKGRVYALDIDSENLNLLSKKIEEKGLDNIELIHTNGDIQTEFENKNFDMILLYDVLHMFNKQQRDKLFDEFH